LLRKQKYAHKYKAAVITREIISLT